MKKDKRNISRRKFVKTASQAALAGGMLAGTPVSILAGGTRSASLKHSGELATSTLGKTGIKMTKLGVGAPRITEASVLRYALDQGISFIDTGRFYGKGKNEVMVSEVIKGKRKDFTIQSKVKINQLVDENLNNESISKKIHEVFNKSLEESLKALQTDYIDILLFHDGSKTELVNHEAVREAFAKAKKEGKILAHGFSAHTNQVELSKKHNADPFYDVMMLAFNPHGGYNKPNVRDYSWDQETLISELKKASAAGTGIVAMKTCFGGPYCCEGDAEKTFAGAVKWTLAQPYVHTSAVAMANFRQLEEHLSVNKS